MFMIRCVVIALAFVFSNLAFANDEFWISDFVSPSRLIEPSDVNHETTAALIGSWRSKHGVSEINEAEFSDFRFACIPYAGGKYGVIPLRMDVLSKEGGVPCWIIWVPADENVTTDWETSIGEKGRLGWIQIDDDSMTLAISCLRTPKMFGHFGATYAPIVPISTHSSPEEFWKIVKKHEDEILHAPYTTITKYERVKDQDRHDK